MGSLRKCRCPDKSKGRHCSRIYTDLVCEKYATVTFDCAERRSRERVQSLLFTICSSPHVVPHVVIEERAARVHVLGLPAHGYWPGAGFVIKEDFMETFVWVAPA